MTPIKRPLAAAGAAVLLALSLSACGGGAPTDASEKAFCKAALDTPFAQDLEEDDYDGQADALHDYADKLEEVGTPEGIPDDARKGFEATIEAYNEISSDDLKEANEDKNSDIEKEFEEKYKDSKDDVEAFGKYQTETCADEATSGIPGSTGSDSGEGTDPGVGGTDIPTDIPTDLPTDIPTSPEELESYLSDLPTEIPSE